MSCPINTQSSWVVELLLSCGKTFPSVCAQSKLKGFRTSITNALHSIANQSYLPIFKTAHPYWERTELYSILKKEVMCRINKHGLLFFYKSNFVIKFSYRDTFSSQPMNQIHHQAEYHFKKWCGIRLLYKQICMESLIAASKWHQIKNNNTNHPQRQPTTQQLSLICS